MRGLEGKVAVVTGGARGLGAASARRLAAAGARVVVVDVDGEGADAVAASLPGTATSVQADVGNENDVDRYIAAALDAFGRVDLHHLNAGVFGTFDALPDLPVVAFEQVMRINVTGAFLGLRAAFQQFRRTGRAGSVVVTASIASLGGSSDLVAYHTSKHAVVGLVREAAVYGGPRGIRVNAVAPGIVPTALFEAAGSTVGGGGDMARRAGTTPLRRPGAAEEIADVVAYLLSEESSYITGQVVSADGGASIVNTVRPSGGAGAWDTDAVDEPTYRSWPVMDRGRNENR